MCVPKLSTKYDFCEKEKSQILQEYSFAYISLNLIFLKRKNHKFLMNEAFVHRQSRFIWKGRAIIYTDIASFSDSSLSFSGVLVVVSLLCYAALFWVFQFLSALLY